MKEAIAHCFQKDGLLEEARLPATYQRAILVLTEAVIVPDEVEVEEEAFEDEAVLALEDNQFDIEISQDDFGDRASDAEDADDVAEEEEAEKAKEIAPNPPKRQRKQNTMVGGVKKGKYSIN